MRCKLALFLAFLFFIGLASASFQAGNFSSQKSYSSGDKFLGWVNISFTNQSPNDTITDNFGNSIKILEILSLNSKYNYTYDETNSTLNSSYQRLYFDNASFYLPVTYAENILYRITIGNQTILEVNISISNAKTLIPARLNQKKSQLLNLTAKIDTYPLFLRVRINSELGISQLQGNLSEITSLYNSSDDYDKLLAQLNSIEIPLSLSEAESASGISFIPDSSVIDLEFLQSIGGGNYDSSYEDSYRESILFWTQENLNPKITFKKINVIYETHVETLITYIELTTDTTSETAFFVTEELEGLEFEKNYNQQSQDDYVYIDLSEVNDIVLTTSEELVIDSLPMFIAPSLDQISVSGNESIIDSEKEDKISKWVIFSLLAILIIIIFIVSYFILHSWYNKKYESYLFPNRNNLYNLIVYINNAKRKGVKNDEIEKNLRKAKWTNEQIRFVIRKYAGKRVGMWNPFSKGDTQNQSHKI